MVSISISVNENLTTSGVNKYVLGVQTFSEASLLHILNQWNKSNSKILTQSVGNGANIEDEVIKRQYLGVWNMFKQYCNNFLTALEICYDYYFYKRFDS